MSLNQMNICYKKTKKITYKNEKKRDLEVEKHQLKNIKIWRVKGNKKEVNKRKEKRKKIQEEKWWENEYIKNETLFRKKEGKCNGG